MAWEVGIMLGNGSGEPKQVFGYRLAGRSSSDGSEAIVESSTPWRLSFIDPKFLAPLELPATATVVAGNLNPTVNSLQRIIYLQAVVCKTPGGYIYSLMSPSVPVTSAF